MKAYQSLPSGSNTASPAVSPRRGDGFTPGVHRTRPEKCDMRLSAVTYVTQPPWLHMAEKRYRPWLAPSGDVASRSKPERCRGNSTRPASPEHATTMVTTDTTGTIDRTGQDRPASDPSQPTAATAHRTMATHNQVK